MGSILTKSCEHILEGGFLGAVQYEESKIIGQCKQRQASQVALVVKKHPANAGDRRDVGSIPGTGRSPGGGNGTSLQYSCLGNPTDRGAWSATVHGVAKSQTGLVN